ncbi:MFS domain-containing protein [Aphelenchoides bicaudatus]|nr:MFS domain-containing protein [Aphelenchoides bicaudatus]
MENLEKFETTNRFLLFSIFMPMSSVWTIYSFPMLVSSFSVGQTCTNSTDCIAAPGSLSEDFNLTGSRSNLGDFSTSAFMIGCVFGAVLVPRFADLKGRKPLLIFGMFMLGLLGCASAFSVSIYMFIVLRCLQGVFFPTNGIISFVLAYESLPRKLRDYAALVFGMLWVTGYCIVGPVAYFLPNWRHLMLACSIPSIFSSIAYWIVVPESFHFMMSKKMEPQLDKWLNKANKTKTIVTVNAKTLIAEHMRSLLRDSNRDRNLIVQLCTHKKLLLYIVVLSYLWLTDTMLYYGLSLYSSDLAGNKYVNYVLSGLIEVPSYLISPYLLNKMGRRLFVGSSHLLAAVAFLILIFVEHSTVVLVLWLIAKFGISCSFTSLFIYASELFPTTVRSGCIGICEILARIGGSISPLVHSIGQTYTWLPGIFFTVVAAIAGFVTFVLPETRDQNLPDTTLEVVGVQESS